MDIFGGISIISKKRDEGITSLRERGLIWDG
jgi:hypothetical protein